MLQLIQHIFAFGLSIIMAIVGRIAGIILSIFFVLIPTILLDGDKLVPYIEKDLCISVPEGYQIKEKHADWFAFEENEEIIFSFDDTKFEKLVNQVNAANCDGKWNERDEDFEFKQLNADKVGYIYSGYVSKKEKTLQYKYSRN